MIKSKLAKAIALVSMVAAPVACGSDPPNPHSPEAAKVGFILYVSDPLTEAEKRMIDEALLDEFEVRTLAESGHLGIDWLTVPPAVVVSFTLEHDSAIASKFVNVVASHVDVICQRRVQFEGDFGPLKPRTEAGRCPAR